MRFARFIAFAAIVLAAPSISAQPEPAPPEDETLGEAEAPEEGASASTSGSHIAYSMRNLTTPEGTFALHAGPASNLDLNGSPASIDFGLNQLLFKDLEFCILGSCTVVEIDDPLFLIVGGSFGITKDLEVGAIVLPLELSPDFEYGDPAVWTRYRFLTGDIEVGGQLLVFVPINSSDFLFEAGAPVRVRGGVRVDTGLYLQVDTGGDFGLRLPATVAANVTEAFFLGGRTGLVIPRLDNIDSGWMPLEVLLGYTVAGTDAPLVDITLAGGFPFFVAFGGMIGRDSTIITEIGHIAVGANAYF